jgi:hypothetical protein
MTPRLHHTSSSRPRSLVVRTGRPLDATKLRRLEKVAATCPVRRALDGAVVFTERIEPAAMVAPLARAV